VRAEIRQVAIWTAVLFLPIAMLGFYLVASHGGAGKDALAPLGMFLILPWVALSELGAWSGPGGLLAYLAQYLWSLPWVALLRWLARRATNAEREAKIKKAER